MAEYSGIEGSSYTIPAKNHAIGWCFDKKYALFINDFGGLTKKKVGEYNYINLDAFGFGFTYRTPSNIKLSLSVAYGMVSFAHNWWEATGDNKGNGYAVNLSLDKEWLIAKHWGIGVGPQVFFLKANNTGYKFMNFSLNGFVVFYFSSAR